VTSFATIDMHLQYIKIKVNEMCKLARNAFVERFYCTYMGETCITHGTDEK